MNGFHKDGEQVSRPDDRGRDLRSGYSITASQQQAIDRAAEELVGRLPAHFVLVVEVSGQVIAYHGVESQTAQTVNLVALGALVAGDLAASQEIARLAGEYQECQMVLREGRRSHLFISEAGNCLAVLVRVGNDVPLGWARMNIREASRRLAEILQMDKGEMPIRLDKKIAEGLGSLGQSLDAIWMEDRDVR